MKLRLFYGVMAGALVFLFAFHLAWGAVSIPLGKVWAVLWGDRLDATLFDIVWEVRLPRALAAMLAGAGLAVAGLLMQTFFQNPLAEPSVLGLSSGASLGVALLRLGGGWLLPIAQVLGAWTTATTAMLGAGGVMLVMLGIATRVRSPHVLLLVGIMLGNFAYAFISLLQHFSSAEAVMDFWRWSMGSVASVNWAQLQVWGVLSALAYGGAFMLCHRLNGWLLGEVYARSLGIDMRSTRAGLIVCVSILAGATTAFCGAISFIGLAVPAPTRALLRTSRHEVLLPAVALAGAVLLLFCDAIAKLSMQGALPLNVITALIGSPVIVWVLLGAQKKI